MVRFIIRLHMSRSASTAPPSWSASAKIILPIRSWKINCHRSMSRRSPSPRTKSSWYWSQRHMQSLLLSCLVNSKSSLSLSYPRLLTTTTVITRHSISSRCRIQRSLTLISSLLMSTETRFKLLITTTVCTPARQGSWQHRPSFTKKIKEIVPKWCHRQECQIRRYRLWTSETHSTHHNAVKVMISAQT